MDFAEWDKKMMPRLRDDPAMAYGHEAAKAAWEASAQSERARCERHILDVMRFVETEGRARNTPACQTVMLAALDEVLRRVRSQG